MSSTPTFSLRQMREIVKRSGYKLVRITGSHEIYQKEDKTLVIAISRQNKMIFQRLVKEHGLKIK